VKPRRLGVVTGSRADYGLLYWVLKEIQADRDLELLTFVTGMHLAPEFGSTWQQIEKDGFPITARVDMLERGDDAVAVTRSVGRGVIGFAEALQQHRPDMLVVLGDRFEILAAAQAALLARIPLAHIAGGDTTEGAVDESIRHAITKMAHLHFPTNEAARERIVQMGEDPRRAFNFGSPGIDFIRRMQFLDRAALVKALDLKFQERNLLITFHPATLDPASQAEQVGQVLEALDGLGKGVGLFFTAPNADVEGRAVGEAIAAFVEDRGNARLFSSLGSSHYLSLMKQVDAVVGNSSSGLYEAPTLHKPTVNIGDRQRGRLRATSVVDCAINAAAIREAIQRAFNLDCSQTGNPYGDGNAAGRIVQELKAVVDPAALLMKHFHECR
jgi:UDP-hydrolysing UDP-N-acetyl-D-glucosamine 2-epimerase